MSSSFYDLCEQHLQNTTAISTERWRIIRGETGAYLMSYFVYVEDNDGQFAIGMGDRVPDNGSSERKFTNSTDATNFHAYAKKATRAALKKRLRRCY